MAHQAHEDRPLPPLLEHSGSLTIRHYLLPGLFPDSQIFAFNTELDTLMQIAFDMSGSRLIAEQQFTTSETSVLLPLLNSFPHFCPYEELLASFNNGEVTDALIVFCRQRLLDAQHAGVWDREMRPVRNVLSRTRLKLHAFGIDVKSLLETGYVLMLKPKPRGNMPQPLLHHTTPDPDLAGS